MDINQVEKLLSVSRANIRFYEKEGLISPKRKENNYRDYSDSDVLQLKKILVFRKLGVTIEEIHDMQNDVLSLDETLEKNIKRLEDTICDLKGSLEIAQKIQKEHDNFENIDESYYWNIIDSAEKAGKKFTDICNDYLKWELNIFNSMCRTVFFFDFEKQHQKYGALITCSILFLICIIRGLSYKFLSHGSFWEGFSSPFAFFLICSLILLPLYILSKKAPIIAGIIISILLVAIVAFFVLLALLLIVLLLN